MRSLSVHVVSGVDLAAEDRAAVLHLCSGAYNCDFEPLFGTFYDAIHILGCCDRRLVSHALWVPRWLQCSGRPPMRTAYVEAVATEQVYRGRGCASAVMDVLAAAITDFDVGALSPARSGIYLRLGWELWRGPLSIRTEHGPHATPDEDVMVLRLPRTPPLDLDAPLSVEWRDGEVW